MCFNLQTRSDIINLLEKCLLVCFCLIVDLFWFKLSGLDEEKLVLLTPDVTEDENGF